MASKITLVFLITVTVALLTASYFLVRQGPIEAFQDRPYSVNDLDINTCPTFTSEIQTAKGSTDCCQGDMVDGKCNGTTFCTKSPAYTGVLGCVDKWRDYFKEKGTSVCPATMPNYFEDVTNAQSLKGCSAGPIHPNGSLPSNATARQCKVYASEGDNRTKADSCYVEKMRSSIQCPVVKGQSPPTTLQRWFWKDNTLLAFFTCTYPFEIGMPELCYDKKSVEAYWDSETPNWRTNPGYSSWLARSSCDNYIKRRQESQSEATRLQAEQAAREAAEKGRREEEERRRAAEEDARRKASEASRLQQQLDEANRRLQNCRT
jgi:hypothetical protein